MFGSRRPPQHPALAIWVGSVHANSSDELEGGGHQRGVRRRPGEKEEEGDGIAPWLKNRDPHLAGGE